MGSIDLIDCQVGKEKSHTEKGEQMNFRGKFISARGADREDELRGKFISARTTDREGRSEEHSDDWRDKNIPAK
jgi:hypothetical protein